MSGHSLFFHSLSTLCHHRCASALDHILAETDDLIAQIRYQKQVEAPFWHVLLSGDGTVVQICQNFAGYFGQSPAAMAGRSMWRFIKCAFQVDVQAMIWQAMETGRAVYDTFPGRYGAQLGVVICGVPWHQERLGDVACLIWPLQQEAHWASFAFQPFDGLRVGMLLDDQGRILATDSAIACRLGGIPRQVVGHSLFELYPPGIQDGRLRAFQELVFTGCAAEWIERNGCGLSYDVFKLPVFDGGEVTQALMLVREHDRAFVDVGAPGLVRVVE